MRRSDPGQTNSQIRCFPESAVVLLRCARSRVTISRVRWVRPTPRAEATAAARDDNNPRNNRFMHTKVRSRRAGSAVRTAPPGLPADARRRSTRSWPCAATVLVCLKIGLRLALSYHNGAHADSCWRQSDRGVYLSGISTGKRKLGT